MALTNAEKQAAWRARREEELRELQLRVRSQGATIRKLERKLRKLAEPAKRRKFHLDCNEQKHTAYHEAGHAVIGLAFELPVAYVFVPSDRAKVGCVGMAHERNRSIGRVYRLIGDRWKPINSPKAAALDAFGNPPRQIERTPGKHHAEIVMCFAGPMAEAKLRNQNWRPLASSSDMSIARRHRGKLGGAAKSWKEYQREAAALVDEYWPMIKKAAERSMKEECIGASEVDDVCVRVVREQAFQKVT